MLLVEIIPINGSGDHTIYVGLFEQLHYVGLDKISDIPPDEGDDFIDNENVHEGY